MTDKNQEIIEGKIDVTPEEEEVMDEMKRRIEEALEGKQRAAVSQILDLTNEISEVCNDKPTHIVMDAVMTMLIHVLIIMEEDDRDEFIDELSDRVRYAVDEAVILSEKKDSANDEDA